MQGKPLLQGYGDYEFYSDMELAPFVYPHRDYFRMLDKQYPGSKFILNVRDKSRWLLSRARHGNYCQLFARQFGMTVTDVLGFWSRDWDCHVQNVATYFRDTDRCLVFDIENDSIEKVARFLPKLQFSSTDHWQKTNVCKSNLPPRLSAVAAVIEGQLAHQDVP
jgi:hypothetical protein